MQSCIFEGRVSHRRREPVRHAFGYGLFMVYIDLAELPQVFAGRWLWSARRTAFARFRRRDHYGDPRVPLAESIRDLVERATGRKPTGPIRLLTHLAYLGYCFNPVSFYYCFDARGARVTAIVAEVTNTPWGERRCYVLDASAQRAGSIRHFAPRKALHVSPFMPMDVTYDWRFTEPGERLAVAMTCARDGRQVFDAALVLRRREIDGATLARVLVRYPLATLGVIAAIHWQALKLWLKGSPVHEHPAKRAAAGGAR